MTDDLEKRLRDLEEKFSDSPDHSFLTYLLSNKNFRKILIYSGALIFGGIWALNIYTPESNQIKIERKTTISHNYNFEKKPISDQEKIDRYLSAGLARQSEVLTRNGVELADSTSNIQYVLDFYNYHKDYTSDNIGLLEDILIGKKIIPSRDLVVNKKEPEKVSQKEFYDNPPQDTTNNKQPDENILNMRESLDPATEISRESLPQESVSEQAVNEPKVEDPLKIYESLNPNSEFSRSTPSNHAPVVIERRDENNNVISQETKYLTRKELEESAVTEIEINYPGTGNRYPISREKYQKFYKKLDKNKDGKLDLEELGRYSYEFNMVTKKYTEGDIENIVKEFLRSIK